jgi:hypothetical protein
VERYYSTEDVARWEASYAESIAAHLQRLTDPRLPESRHDFHLGMLSLSHRTRAMICVARGRFGDAVAALRASVEARCRMYERSVAGVGRPLEAGHFQTVLDALATRDDTLVDRIGRHYRADVGTRDSVFLGTALRSLVLNDVPGACSALGRERPRFERQFVGYVECLQAVAAGDDQRFPAALALASGSWAEWAARQVRGLPDSVCFLHGAGFVRLAERVFRRRVPVADAHIPSPLLQ